MSARPRFGIELARWGAALASLAALATGCTLIAGVEDLSVHDAGVHGSRDGGRRDARADSGGKDATLDAAKDARFDARRDATLPSVDAGLDADAGCHEESVRCEGDQPQTCIGGRWRSVVVDGSGAGGVCPGACLLGRCVQCAPGSSPECNDNAVRKCTDEGAWDDAGACAGNTPFCAAGACGQIPPSCAAGGPGVTHCGHNQETCCATTPVYAKEAGTTFYRLYDLADGGRTAVVSGDGGATNESYPATVHTFRLDNYDVTVGRFRAFVNDVVRTDGGALPEQGSGKHVHLHGGLGLVNGGRDGGADADYEPGWNAADNANVLPGGADVALLGSCMTPTWTSTPPDGGAGEDLPITCASWYEAYAFCIWDQGFLPSQAEWEFAASGAGAQLEYPWGSAPPGTENEYAIYGGGQAPFFCYYPNGGGDGGKPACTGIQNIAPVGTPPGVTTPWHDLAGNVFQWNLDWSAFFPYYNVPCVDCANVGPGESFRVLRGGGFNSPSFDLLPASPNGAHPPAGRLANIGFRCARSPL